MYLFTIVLRDPKLPPVPDLRLGVRASFVLAALPAVNSKKWCQT